MSTVQMILGLMNFKVYNKVLSTMILSTMNDNALEMVKCMNMDFDNPILWNIFCHSLGQTFVT